jgi:hypothetical protein
MNSPIKIIKRQRDEDSIDLKPAEIEKSVEQSTREMVSTVKSWVTELQQRKRAQALLFPSLPVIAAAQVRQNT